MMPTWSDQTGVIPATGDFYFQASDGSVTVPAAGYHYDMDWAPFDRRDFHPLEWQLASLH